MTDRTQCPSDESLQGDIATLNPEQRETLCGMDAFTQDHLDAWLAYVVHDDVRDVVRVRIYDYVAQFPEVLTRYDWPTIRLLSER